ncbi:hypothetical protein KR009_000720 [Drosophila setifemur]|nr:hypothetical protein KR009_000720 [Drosophila setifemur]
MAQIRTLYLLLAVLAIVVLAANVADADCLSGKFKGGCMAWDGELCRRLCREEGRQTGHCSWNFKCWCEGC